MQEDTVKLTLVSSCTQPDDKPRLHGEEETRTHENHTASTQVGDEGGGKEKKPGVVSGEKVSDNPDINCYSEGEHRNTEKRPHLQKCMCLKRRTPLYDFSE